MQSINKALAVFSLSLGMAVGVAPSLVAAPGAWFQYGEGYENVRALVDRTQTDLRQSQELEHNNGDQRERYRNAQGHLSTFDRHMTKGHFDKGELDKAIHDIQSVLDNNSLQASARDALLRDVQDLRAVRERRY